MAIHHYLLTESSIEGKVGMSSYLRFDGDTVTVEWKNGETVSMPAAVGDVIFVNCWGGLPEIGKTLPPKRLDRLALWLVGVSKDDRYLTRESAEKEFDHYVDHYVVIDLGPDSLECRHQFGDRWFIGQRRSFYTNFRWENFCGWVSPDITPAEVREIVEQVGSRWSHEYTEKVLSSVGGRGLGDNLKNKRGSM